LVTEEPIGYLVRKGSVIADLQKDTSKSTPFYRMVVSIIHFLAESGPVLVIESTRPMTISMAKAIADAQDPVDLGPIQLLIDLVQARLGADHPLLEVLKKGVVYHHGSLPSEIRVAIEEAVSIGALRFLVATTTMTEGVNLPVRSVVIASQGSYGSEGYTDECNRPCRTGH
jgi:replicative superfamily II helicase